MDNDNDEISVSKGRLARLIDLPMPLLRIIAFNGGADRPTQREADERFAGWTRGELVAHIVDDAA